MARTEVIKELSAPGDDIRTVTLHRVSLPLRHPLESAHGLEERRESTLVHVELAGGASGWGECAALARATYTAEYADGAFGALRDVLVPGLLARSEPVGDQPMAAAAVEGAVVDARLRARDQSLVGRLGASRRSVPIAAVIGRVATVDELLTRVAALVDQSVAAVSVKIAPGWDVEPIHAVRTSWPALPVSADGNGAYRRADLAHLVGLADLGLHHLEQPLPADDLAGLAELRDAIAVPLVADESVPSLAALERVTDAGAVDAVNVKPARVGGLAPALAIVERAVERGLSLYVGGMLETGVGRAYALALAALDEITWPTHLGPSDRYFAQDVTEPIVVDRDGRVVVPDGAGIGVTPVPARVAAVEIDRVVLTAGTT